MKRFFLLLSSGFVAYFSAAQSIDIGSKMPLSDRHMESVNAKRTTLDAAKKENGLLVMFSCNTCPYVVKAQQRTKEVMHYAASKKLGMIIVNSNEAYRSKDDAPAAMKKYAKEQEYNVPYLIDEQSLLADAFGAMRTPEVFLFNANDVLVYKGAMEDSPADPGASKELFLKDAIDNMLSGKEIAPASTKSIGCTIKRVK